MRQIPQSAIDLVKQSEGCVLRVYDDTRPSYLFDDLNDQIIHGKLTAGYGHTATNLKIGMPVTQSLADDWLVDDLKTAAFKLESQIGADIIGLLTDNQYAALLDFVFNLGASDTWTIWKRLKAKQFDQVPLEIAKFVNAGGKKLEGLVNRRNAEIALWATGEPGTSNEPISSSVSRAVETAPTPSDPVPFSQSKALLTGIGGSVLAAPVMGDKIIEAFSTYSNSDHASTKLLALAAIVATILAIASIGYVIRMKRNATN